jgi:hypothetical protein
MTFPDPSRFPQVSTAPLQSQNFELTALLRLKVLPSLMARLKPPAMSLRRAARTAPTGQPRGYLQHPHQLYLSTPPYYGWPIVAPEVFLRGLESIRFVYQRGHRGNKTN